MKKPTMGAFLFAILTFPASLWATDQGVLTLEEALQRTAANSPRAEAARARMDRAAGVRQQTRAALYPSLDFTARMRESGNLETAPLSSEAQRSEEIGLSMSLTLLDVPTWRRNSAQNLVYEATRREQEDAQRGILFEVAESFFDVLSSAKMVSAAEGRLQLADEIVTSSRVRLERGLVNRNVLTRSELERSSAALALARARNAHLKSKLALATLMGEENIPTNIAPPPQLADISKDVTTLENSALEQRPDLRALAERSQAAAILAREPWMRLIPRVMLEASVLKPLNAARTDPQWAASLNLRWSLYDATRYADVRVRGAEYQESLALERQRRDEARLLLRRLIADVETAEATVQQAELQTKFARENLEQVRLRFAQDLATALEVVDASQAEYQASLDQEVQNFSLRSAQLGLLRAVGLSPLPLQERVGAPE